MLRYSTIFDEIVNKIDKERCIPSLMPMLAAYQNFFVFFFFDSSYVSFVPVSDVLAIFVSDRQCEFPSNFSFVIKKKTCFGK